ncbi:MAG: hypothetical protein HRT45_18900, partial [Bdellovibrionales bacterium]|nr:hypothetical protein [Bdellovibrionales bacterium]
NIGAFTVWDSVRYSSPNRQGEVDQFVRDANGELRLQSYGSLVDDEGQTKNPSICTQSQIDARSCPLSEGLFDDTDGGFPVRNFWQRGELLPVAEFHEPSNRWIRQPESPRFVSKADGDAQQVAENLKALLNVEVIRYEYQKRADGTQVRCDFRGDNPNSRDCTDENGANELSSIIPGTGRGPEIEEIYSPIQAALTSNELKSGPNNGFFRRDALKVVVILTDAPDASVNISEQELKFLLENSTDREEGHRVAVYSITPTGSNCTDMDPDFGNPDFNDIADFVRLFGDAGKSYNLCSNFGDQLAEIGQDVVERTLALTEIPLDRYPSVTQESIRDRLNLPGGIVAGDGTLYPELDCNPELLTQVYQRLAVPLAEDETPAERLEQVDRFVSVNHPRLPFEVRNWGPDWLRVCYDTQRVPVYSSSTGFGFQWDKQRNSIKIRGAEKLNPVDGGEFQVLATELDLRNATNGLIEYTR